MLVGHISFIWILTQLTCTNFYLIVKTDYRLLLEQISEQFVSIDSKSMLIINEK